MTKMYKYPASGKATPAELEQMIQKLKFSSGNDTNNLTLKDALWNPTYRMATWVNIGYIIFHELTGINVILLYSNTILAKSGKFKPRTGTQIIGDIDVFGTFCSIFAVKYFGRRTLVVWGHLAIALAHFGVAYSIG